MIGWQAGPIHLNSGRWLKVSLGGKDIEDNLFGPDQSVHVDIIDAIGLFVGYDMVAKLTDEFYTNEYNVYIAEQEDILFGDE